jgi:oligoendopeptidase F
MELEGLCPHLQSDISAVDFSGMIDRMEAIFRVGQRIFTYAVLLSAENVLDPEVRAFKADIIRLCAEATNRQECFWSWWRSTAVGDADRLLAFTPEYAHFLKAVRTEVTSPPGGEAEHLIALENETETANLLAQYDDISTRARNRSYAEGAEQYSRDRWTRERAYDRGREPYGEAKDEFEAIYQAIVRHWRREYVNSGYASSALGARNRMNEVDDEIIDEMLTSCRHNASIFRRFLNQLTAKIGVEQLRMSDFTDPRLDTGASCDFSSASERLLTAYHAFHPEMELLAERVFVEHHIASVPRSERAPGAFTTSIGPDTTSWVTLPYYQTFFSQSQLAHEMGHAVHYMLVDHHSALMHRSSLLVGETAAAFSEVLLFEQLFQNAKDEPERQGLLVTRLVNLNQAIMVQAYLALFEVEAHELLSENASGVDLRQLFQANLKEEYEESVQVSQPSTWEWMRNSHLFHQPFYIYSYPFAQLLALALHQKYVQEGPGIADELVDVWKLGGKARVQDLLALASGKPSPTDVWQPAFDIIDAMVDRAFRS